VVIPFESETRAAGHNLCAYIVWTEAGDGSIPQLRERLAEKLPAYMAPGFFVPLDSLPLTANGKLDRRALPDPRAANTGAAATPPRNDTDAALVKIWSDILGIEPGGVSIDASFFDLGGHSLKAVSIAARINKDLGVRIPLVELFNGPTIRELGDYILAEASAHEYSPIPHAEKARHYPLSSAQKRLFIMQQRDKNSMAYNIYQAVELGGTPDKAVFQSILDRLIRRHESFRTSFRIIDNQPRQVVHDEVECPIEVRRMDSLELAGALRDFVRPFDLSRAPILRVCLVEAGGGRLILLMDMHHIIIDGVSMLIFADEFKRLHAGEEPAPPGIQYKDYCKWMLEESQQAMLDRQKQFWLEEFGGDIPLLNLPTDFARPAIKRFEGETVGFILDVEESRLLKQFARDKDVTPFMLFIAVFYLFLARLTGQEDIVMGVPTAGRSHPDVHHIIGMFVNTLAIRNYPRAGITFSQFLEDVKASTLKAFDHQEFQFEDLVEDLGIEKRLDRNPLFDVMFAMQDFEIKAVKTGYTDEPAGGLSMRQASVKLAKKTAKFDLTLFAEERAERFAFFFEYDTQLFGPETVRRMIDDYTGLLFAAVKDAGAGLGDLRLKSLERDRQTQEVTARADIDNVEFHF
jgi:acyl carrier protein